MELSARRSKTERKSRYGKVARSSSEEHTIIPFQAITPLTRLTFVFGDHFLLRNSISPPSIKVTTSRLLKADNEQSSSQVSSILTTPRMQEKNFDSSSNISSYQPPFKTLFGKQASKLTNQFEISIFLRSHLLKC